MRRLCLTFAAALAAFGAVAPAEAAKRRPAKKQLTAFRSCDGLVTFAERRVRRFGSDVFSSRRPIGVVAAPMPAMGAPAREQASADGSAPVPATAAPVAGTDFSGTNVQEQGVDEPDAVKTDGRRMYVAMADKLYALDITGDAPRIVATLPLEGYSHELLLRDGKLLVVSTAGFDGPMPMPAEGAPARSADVIVPYVPRTKLIEVNAADLRVLNTLEVPGTIVGGRLSGSTARIAIATQTGVPPEEGAPPVRRWLPAMQLERASGRILRRSVAPCTAVRRPDVFAGLGLLSVLTIDLDRGLNPVDSDAILADASTVYASKSRMYFATERWVDPQVIAEDGAPAGRSTQIHGFDVSDGDATRYVGGGSVRGYLLNQFSLSEHKGALRVATTEDPPWFFTGAPQEGQQSESFVTVLDETAGRLAQVGRVGGLGKGERIYAVRFVEDVGFVVTFRQVDPLYTLDLSQKDAPRVVGELKIPGFSSYLHPIGDGLMLGIGQDATDEGRTRGAQVSLFDVSDLRDPRRLHAQSLGPHAYTTAEHDHHAFTWWAPAKLLVVPLVDYRPEEQENPFVGAIGLRVDRRAITEAGRTQHPRRPEGYTPDIIRSVVANDRLFTISAFGVQAGRLDTLAGTAWVPFNP